MTSNTPVRSRQGSSGPAGGASLRRVPRSRGRVGGGAARSVRACVAASCAGHPASRTHAGVCVCARPGPSALSSPGPPRLGVGSGHGVLTSHVGDGRGLESLEVCWPIAAGCRMAHRTRDTQFTAGSCCDSSQLGLMPTFELRRWRTVPLDSLGNWLRMRMMKWS